jgi:hypothetical protein
LRGYLTLAVVDDDQAEERVGLDVARKRRGFLHQADTFASAPAEPCQVREEPRGHGQLRDTVTIETDDQPGILPPGIELEATFLFLVSATRRAQRAEDAPLDRTDE